MPPHTFFFLLYGSQFPETILSRPFFSISLLIPLWTNVSQADSLSYPAQKSLSLFLSEQPVFSLLIYVFIYATV